jgi:hypothetical protein
MCPVTLLYIPVQFILPVLNNTVPKIIQYCKYSMNQQANKINELLKLIQTLYAHWWVAGSLSPTKQCLLIEIFNAWPVLNISMLDS